MKESIKHIGKLLKEARLNKGLTQRALSAKTKIPQNHISKIENGEVDLQASTILEISRSLEIELMFVPVHLVKTVEALLRPKRSDKQIPKYSLDQEDSDG